MQHVRNVKQGNQVVVCVVFHCSKAAGIYSRSYFDHLLLLGIRRLTAVGGSTVRDGR